MTQPNTSSVAVVILNWNGRHHLETYLPSVVEHTSSEHIIWVAGQRKRGRQRVVASRASFRGPAARVGPKLGFAAGYNEGLAHRCRCLCVAQFGRAHGRSLGRACVGGDERTRGMWRVHWSVRTLAEHLRTCRRCRRMDGQGRLSLLSWDGMFENNGNRGRLAGPKPGGVLGVGRMFFHSQVCVPRNGFDGSLFAHMEEIDLCWRLKNEGHRVGCAGTVSVAILAEARCRPPVLSRRTSTSETTSIVMLKNRDGFWPAFMFRRMTLDGIAAWKNACRRTMASIPWPWVKAHAHSTCVWPPTLRKRGEDVAADHGGAHRRETPT